MAFGVAVILCFFFLIAFMYSSVGHGGGSGYIALMVLLGLSDSSIRPAALWMNIAVSLIGTLQFYRAGHFRKELLFPFLILSVPMALVGGCIQLSSAIFRSLVGVCLIVAIARLLFTESASKVSERPLPKSFVLPAGGIIGLISGMIGIGGGILLSPLLVISRRATLRQSAAVAAPFIFVNSSAALVSGGFVVNDISPMHLFAWILAVVAGGWLGSYVGCFRFSVRPMKFMLAAVLLIAVVKLFTA